MHRGSLAEAGQQHQHRQIFGDQPGVSGRALANKLRPPPRERPSIRRREQEGTESKLGGADSNATL